MRLILSRKGFDSSSGGCPSPIFPDCSMCASDPTSGPVCVTIFLGVDAISEASCETHSREAEKRLPGPSRPRPIWPRNPGWCPTLGQIGSAQGHLRKQGVGPGDLFLFWASFRRVDEDLRWKGGTEHHIWGWLQIGDVVSVDEVVHRQNCSKSRTYAPLEFRAEDGETPPLCSMLLSSSSHLASVSFGRCVGAAPTWCWRTSLCGSK